jgi:hypothetical protein
LTFEEMIQEIVKYSGKVILEEHFYDKGIILMAEYAILRYYVTAKEFFK